MWLKLFSSAANILTLQVFTIEYSGMKRYIFLFLIGICCQANAQGLPFPGMPSSPKHETRAVWLTTFSSLDWPKTKATTDAGRAAQQEELRHMLDRMQEARINTVLLQTRVRGTTIYPSSIEPWDGCLTGTPGLSPGYDPLAFAIEECHKRGMELHAWIVTIPCFKTAAAAKTGTRSVLKTHPRLCIRHEDSWYLDPGQPQTADYLTAICKEIAEKYDVDGIHMDYIRYPENASRFNDRESYRKYGRGQNKSKWRRDNITRCVRRMYTAIKDIKPWIKVSCSPVGKHDDLSRYSSYGWNARTAVHQDAQAWLQEGIMDILFPMMYFRDNHFYPFAADWKENDHGRIVAPGLGIYFLSAKEKNWPLESISRELYFIRSAGLGGQAYFRYAFLNENHKGIFDFLRDTFYPYPALPMPCTAQDSIAPDMPRELRKTFDGQCTRLQWKPSTDDRCGQRVRYNVYASSGTPADTAQACQLVAAGLEDCSYAIDDVYCTLNHIHFAVTATDRSGNESVPARLAAPPSSVSDPRLLPHDGKRLELPELPCRYIVIEDATGRIIHTHSYARKIHIASLPGGLYIVKTLEKKGRAYRIGEFIK